MATLTHNGRRGYVQVRLDGRRPTIALGRCTRKDAELARGHIDRLELARKSPIVAPCPPATLEWCAALPDATHDRLADAGLVASRASGHTRLAAFLRAYIDRRHADLKPRSVEILQWAAMTLVKHFGADRDLRGINRAEARDWRRAMEQRPGAGGRGAKSARATVAGLTKKAKQFFRDAVERNLIARNPFDGIKPGGFANEARRRYVPRADVRAVIDRCPDAEWRLVFALARFAGLRVPSETHLLRWSDVDWELGRLNVRSPKTEHHAGRECRAVPVAPELLPLLLDAREQAAEGAAFVVARHRDASNLGTRGRRIVERAGLAVWPKLFQNLRASCETDWASLLPIHVACAFAGNSEAVARKHYLQITDEHFSLASAPPRLAAAGPNGTAANGEAGDNCSGDTEPAAGRRAANGAASGGGTSRINPGQLPDNPLTAGEQSTNERTRRASTSNHIGFHLLGEFYSAELPALRELHDRLPGLKKRVFRVNGRLRPRVARPTFTSANSKRTRQQVRRMLAGKRPVAGVANA